MTGAELDRRMREILLKATPETILSSTASLVELGFGPRQSFEMICKVIDHPHTLHEHPKSRGVHCYVCNSDQCITHGDF